MTMGNMIAKYRKELKLTQETLAQMLEVSNQAVSKWESDQCCPDIQLLPRLADIFGISIDALFGREPKSKPVLETDAALPWADDGALRAVLYIGHTLVGHGDAARDITFTYEGSALDVHSAFTVNCTEVEGDVSAGGMVNCAAVGGDVEAGGTVNCGNVDGNVDAGGSVHCGGVDGDVQAGKDVTCGAVSGDVDAGGSVTCDDVYGDVTAGKDVNCGAVSGDVDAGGNVSGDIDAGNNVQCGRVEGDVDANGIVTIRK